VLSAEQRCGSPPLCPDVVIELASTNGANTSGANTSGASPSDQGPRGVTALRHKMAAYMSDGARLGWLLFAEQWDGDIWRPGGGVMDPGEPLRIEPALTLQGGELLSGLRLELSEIWSS